MSVDRTVGDVVTVRLGAVRFNAPAVATRLVPNVRAAGAAVDPLPLPSTVCVAIVGKPPSVVTEVAAIVPDPLVARLAPVPTTIAALELVLALSPENGAAVAVIVPLPDVAKLAPVPTTIAAVVLVDPVSALNAVLPPDPQADPVPDNTPEVLTCKHCVLPVTKLKVTPVVKLGEVPNTSAPVPVSPVTADAKLALDGVAKNVAIPVPNPEIPASGAAVAVIVPEPVAPREEPVPTSIAAVVLVLAVSPENGAAVAVIVPLPVVPNEAPLPTSIAAVVLVLPVSALNAVLPPEPHPAPESSSVVEFNHSAQCPLVMAPLKIGRFAPANVVAPVPPLATGRAVPESPIASVPLVVTGLPAMVRKEGTVTATLVTVPLPPPPPMNEASWLTVATPGVGVNCVGLG
jgi:hypothetical protein